MPNFAKVILIALFALCCPLRSDAGDLTLEWNPPSDGITTGYVLAYGNAPQSYFRQVDVGYTASYAVNDLSDGSTYYFAVRGYNAMGEFGDWSDEVSATVMPSVPPTVTSLALAANVPSPQVAGTTVNWRATAAGGVAPYQFKWALYHAGSWTMWPWTDASTWAWTPSIRGTDYQVRVAVRSSGSSSTSGELTQTVPFVVTAPPAASVTLTADKASPQPAGSRINWSARASGGVAPYAYRWWVFDGSAWRAATGWTTTSTWSWRPKVASAAYIVRVWVRSAGNPNDAAEGSASVPFPIAQAPATCQGSQCR